MTFRKGGGNMASPVFVPGYDRESEDVDRLVAESVPFVRPKAFSAPKSVSVRSWFKIRNQGRKGSCTGFGRTGVSEYSNWLDTKGGLIRLSAEWAYYTNQRACGLLGRDQGATIMSCRDAAMKDGECFDSTFPYSEIYRPQFPAAAAAEAKNHLIQRHSILRSADDWFDWLSTGQGGIVIGIPWTRNLNDFSGVKPLRDIGRGSMGGHCVWVSGYYFDESGDRIFETPNSHGTGYGDQGYLWLHEKAVEQLYDSDYCEAVGFSDIQEWAEPVVRRVEFDIWPEVPK